MDSEKTSFLLGRPIFRCYVSFREGKGLILPRNLTDINTANWPFFEKKKTHNQVIIFGMPCLFSGVEDFASWDLRKV